MAGFFLDDPSARVDSRWWRAREPADALFSCLETYEHHDNGRRAQYLTNARLYGNVDAVGLNLASGYEVRSPNRLTYNVVEAVADTYVNHIARARNRAVFQTIGGDFPARARARQLERFVDATMYTSDALAKLPEVVLHSFVYGDGFIHPYVDGDKICVECVHPQELFVDPAEAAYGDPCSIVRRQWIPLDTLLGLWPDKADVLRASAGTGSGAEEWLQRGALDMVEVVSGWYRAADRGSEKTPGRYVVACRSGVLEDTPWQHAYLPFVSLTYRRRLSGFWGVSGAEKLMGLQTEINRTLHRIQQSLHLVAVPRVFLDHGSRVRAEHINNQIGSILRYSGQKPIFETPQGVSQEAVQHLLRLRDWAFEQEGLSPYQASGQLPPGLTSGVGQREHGEAQDSRNAVRFQAWERLHVKLATQIVDLARDISDRNPKWTVRADSDKYTVAAPKFKEIDLDRDAYVMRAYPTSLLPTLPSGRRSAVIDLLGAGIITDPRTARRLLDLPDLEADTALDQAAEDGVDWAAERMLDHGDVVSPEPFDDLDLCVRRMNAHYLRARNDGVPEDRLQLLRDFMTQTGQLIALREQAAMAVQQGTPQPIAAPPPTGAGGAPPGADLPPQ